MRISDWSSDVCSSDLGSLARTFGAALANPSFSIACIEATGSIAALSVSPDLKICTTTLQGALCRRCPPTGELHKPASDCRSEEHTSELQSIMRISYAVFCLQKKKQK